LVHQVESPAHIGAGLVLASEQGVEQRSIGERDWVGAVGLHHGIAALQCLLELGQIQVF